MKELIGLIATFSGILAFLTQIAPVRQPTAVHPVSDERSEVDLVSHGKYLAHHVAMCVECHTPRGGKGEIDSQRLLAGAPMPVSSPFPDQSWALRAPSLRGLPAGWSEETLVRFLQTGKTPTAYPVQPPMPPFRMTERDAASVVAYLASLDEQL